MKLFAACTAVAAVTCLATVTTGLAWALWQAGYLETYPL